MKCIIENNYEHSIVQHFFYNAALEQEGLDQGGDFDWKMSAWWKNAWLGSFLNHNNDFKIMCHKQRWNSFCILLFNFLKDTWNEFKQ